MASYATFDRPSAARPHAGSPLPPPHPASTASWVSRSFLHWVTPLITLGNAKQLDEHDVWPLARDHEAGVLTAAFAQDFHQSGSILRAFFKSFGWAFALAGLAQFIATATTFAGPVVLNHVVTKLSSGDYDMQDLLLWIIGLLGTQLVQALADTHTRLECEMIAIQFTTTLKNLIYAKSLRLNADSRKLKSTGDIANLCKTDSQMIFDSALYVHQLWILPLQVVVTSVLLYRLLGVASFAGFAVIGITFAINHLLSSRFMEAYMSIMKTKDARVKVVTEAFKSISIVKFNAWENKFLGQIDASRAKELVALWQFLKYISLSGMVTGGVPVFISVATFSFYSGVLHKELTPAVVFTSVSLFQLVQKPLNLVSHIIASVVKAKVAEQRMTEFLALPELESGSVLSLNSPQADEYITKNVIVALDNATLAWSKEAPPLLRNTNLQIHTGEFVVVHGPVGCGKSSLCSALIGDMVKTQGLVYVGGSVAYCSQQPWIQHATVRDNILFGRPFDRKKYDKVIEACALTADLKSLPAGDRTEIGERGVNLSGGQKARVALARACYSDASVYILDAPLSAVDAIVQNEIFTKCLLGLLRHRTVILVTHNPEIIASEHVTRAVTINESGELAETRLTQGGRPSYDPLVTPLPHRAYVKTFEELKGSEENAPHGDGTLEFTEVTEMALGHKSPFRQRAHSANYGDDDEDRGVARDTATTEESHRLVDDEDRQQGRVGFHVFTAYYRAVGGFPVLFLILMSQVFWQGLQIGSDFWLTDWTSDAKSTAGDQPDHEAISTSYRIEVYTLLGLTSALMVLVRTVTVSYFGLRAAKEMFDNMTHALMHAPMKFFDANPIGRILMRYSNDVFNVDFDVPLTFGGFFANFFSAGCTLAVATAIIQWKGLFLLPVMYVYVRIGSFYLQPAREVERVLRTTEAPILSHLSESIEGGAVIRAFGLQQVSRFQSTNNSKLDVANKVWYARLAISRWFGLRIQLLSSLLIFIVAYSLVLLHNELSAAIIGLAFSYVLKVSVSMERIIQAWSSVETTMVSPERMQQYAEVEQEAPHRLPTADPPASAAWPAIGAIDFASVGFRYKDGDRCVLNNLTLSIVGGEKIGIVGRTGAGKSSLTMALFRINELAAGTISIDGVDVGKIGLKTLRDKMSIIPQNPVLFKGPLRKYLDPFDEYTDDQLWGSIRRVGLNERISSEDAKLDCTVEENGENFSVGERQMLCMARALLRDSRIVIFDEATAAIDHETDKKLQRVIREAFDKSTVLTIAHRLDTILDSDRILVLDGGEVVEFASPAELVKKGKGHFFDLMQEGGYLDKFLQK